MIKFVLLVFRCLVCCCSSSDAAMQRTHSIPMGQWHYSIKDWMLKVNRQPLETLSQLKIQMFQALLKCSFAFVYVINLIFVGVPGAYNVLATDYKHYASVYSCSILPNTNIKLEYAFIISWVDRLFFNEHIWYKRMHFLGEINLWNKINAIEPRKRLPISVLMLPNFDYVWSNKWQYHEISILVQFSLIRLILSLILIKR